jgi:signal transduction histidine kinase
VSLRRRLVAGTLLLLVVAVIVTDVVTLSSLRSYLYGRLDEQNDVAQSQAYTYIDAAYVRAVDNGAQAVAADPGAWLEQLAIPPATPPGLGSSISVGPATPAPFSSDVPAPEALAAVGTVPRGGRLFPTVLAERISPDVYVEILDRPGQVVFRRPSGSAGQQDPAPALPRSMPVNQAPPVPRFGTSHGPYLPNQPTFVLDARGHQGGYYLAEALAVPGGTLVTASAIAPTEQTLASLRRVELIVSAVVVLVMLGLTLWTVRLGLRPLDDMTDTARAIAAGDLRRRIRRGDDRNEVGRLASALNGMLSQIEAAFAERTASEGRLRRFVADASHELRTPLTSIRGYAELLRKGALDDEAARRRAAERIEHEATRMGVLVDDLLLLARLDQGRPVEDAPVDLAAVVGDAVEAARAADASHPMTMSAPEPVVVMGDAGRLRQVADNLLHNASVHTPPGTPVRVEVGRRNGHAVLVVADAGPGLSEDEAAHVFDRFFRGERSRRLPGTGLGLSIVSALAVAHGGQAYARSGAGPGAQFVVELPLWQGVGPPAPGGTMAGRERRVADPARH